MTVVGSATTPFIHQRALQTLHIYSIFRIYTCIYFYFHFSFVYLLLNFRVSVHVSCIFVLSRNWHFLQKALHFLGKPAVL